MWEASRLEKIIRIKTVGNTGLEDLVYANNEIKFKMSDCPVIVAYCMDNDNTGVKKAQTAALAAAIRQVPFVAIVKQDYSLTDKFGVGNCSATLFPCLPYSEHWSEKASQRGRHSGPPNKEYRWGLNSGHC